MTLLLSLTNCDLFLVFFLHVSLWEGVIPKQIFRMGTSIRIFFNPLITYYWTVPLILDHSYLVGKLTSSSKIADTKCQNFRSSKVFVSALFEFVKFPTKYELSNIRRPVQ